MALAIFLSPRLWNHDLLLAGKTRKVALHVMFMRREDMKIRYQNLSVHVSLSKIDICLYPLISR